VAVNFARRDEPPKIGGNRAAAVCHVARTVCRRAERRACAAAQLHPLNAEVLRYLNRLSDLLFVLARMANAGGKADVLWVPGQNR
jgi:cob(I)alamin adenosyltransferase